LLVKNGTFITTKLFYIVAMLGISILLIGVLFKIMHWPGANEALIVAFALIFISYALHFIKKPTKALNDWGKLVFLATYIVGVLFEFMHLPFGDLFSIASLFIFIVLVLLFIKKNRLAVQE
jgi:hypothetical protein